MSVFSCMLSYNSTIHIITELSSAHLHISRKDLEHNNFIIDNKDNDFLINNKNNYIIMNKDKNDSVVINELQYSNDTKESIRPKRINCLLVTFNL